MQQCTKHPLKNSGTNRESYHDGMKYIESTLCVGICTVIARSLQSCGICKVVSPLFGILARPFLARPLRTKDSADGHKRGEADLRRRRRETCLPLVRSHKGESRRNQRRTQSSVIVISAVPRRVHTSSVVSVEIGM